MWIDVCLWLRWSLPPKIFYNHRSCVSFVTSTPLHTTALTTAIFFTMCFRKFVRDIVVKVLVFFCVTLCVFLVLFSPLCFFSIVCVWPRHLRNQAQGQPWFTTTTPKDKTLLGRFPNAILPNTFQSPPSHPHTHTQYYHCSCVRVIAVKVPVFVVAPCVFFLFLCFFSSIVCVPASLTQPVEEEKGIHLVTWL